MGIAELMSFTSYDDVQIYTSTPGKSEMDPPPKASASPVLEGVVESPVTFMALDDQLDINSIDVCLHRRTTINPQFAHVENKPEVLKHSDRVQIVSIEDGWAKLARGYGFVKVDASRIVKGTCSNASKCKFDLSNNHLRVRAQSELLLTVPATWKLC